jgi:hypothetical protein
LTHLEDIVAQPKDNDVLHPQIPRDKHHTLRQRLVLVRVRLISEQSVEHVTLKVAQEVHFVAEVSRVPLDGVVLPHALYEIACPCWRDMVKVAAHGRQYQIVRLHGLCERLITHVLPGERTRELVSLKCTAMVPSLMAKPMPYLVQ